MGDPPADDMENLSFRLGPPSRFGGKERRLLECLKGETVIGHLSLGLPKPEDDNDPCVNLDYASVEEPYRGSQVSLALICEVAHRYSGTRIVGGPLTDDDPAGPRYRLRCWDEAEIPIHDPSCNRSHPCDCRARILTEVERRLQARDET